MQQHQPGSSSSSLWWVSGSSSSSSNLCTHTNEQWLQAVELETGFLAESGDTAVCVAVQPVDCDCCRRPLAQLQGKKCNTPGMQLYSCPACGVARYCNSSCAAKDSRNHNRHCRCEDLQEPGNCLIRREFDCVQCANI
jgi:hypothetical protein